MVHRPRLRRDGHTEGRAGEGEHPRQRLHGHHFGVVALAATVIGYVSAPVSRSRRIAFAVSSLLLMAPGLAVSGTYDVLGLVGMGGGEMTLALDVALRAVGLVLFAVLLVENRRQSEGTGTAAGSPEPA